jgi:large subunit ribosomal protein L29
MKPKDLRILSNDELHTRERECKEELFNLRFQKVSGQLSNPLRLRLLRKELARIKTIIHERVLVGGTI